MLRGYWMLVPVLLGASAPLAAKPGPLATLSLGHYLCEHPAAPETQAAISDPRASFEITTASRYVAADGTRGTYLFTGDTIEMTSGSLTTTRLVRLRQGFLRVLSADGVPGPIRCVLTRDATKN